MNRMILPSLATISLRNALSRSSNSPRYFAPAIIALKSIATSRLFLSDSGTSPLTMRRARPSAMAVLPTPGSPMSTGLFFVRRVSTCMTRRISSSRPMTGSIFPCRASAVRSRPYLSSAWNLASGFSSVTRWLPRNSASALSTASRFRPCLAKIFFSDEPATVHQAEQQMFGADVIVLELGRLGLRGIERLSQIAAGVGVARALDLVPAGEFGLQIRFQPGDRHTDAFQQIGNEAVALADEREREMFAVDFLMRIIAGEALRLRQRLLRFLGQLFRLHDANLTQRRQDAKMGNFNHGWARIPVREKAAEGRRTPKPGGKSERFGPREASWTAPALWRFGTGTKLFAPLRLGVIRLFCLSCAYELPHFRTDGLEGFGNQLWRVGHRRRLGRRWMTRNRSPRSMPRSMAA